MRPAVGGAEDVKGRFHPAVGGGAKVQVSFQEYFIIAAAFAAINRSEQAAIGASDGDDVLGVGCPGERLVQLQPIASGQ